MSYRKKFTFDNPEDSYWNESDSAGSSYFDDLQSKQLKARAAVDNLFGQDDASTPTFHKQDTKLSPNHQVADVRLSSASPRLSGMLVDEYIHQKSISVTVTRDNGMPSAASVVSEASASSLPSEAQRLDLDYSRLKAEHRKLQQHLDNVKYERFRPVDIQVAVKRLLRGEPVALEFYKSLKDKEDLLQAAVSCYDQSVILKVVVFLKNSTSKPIFTNFMKTSPEASSVYIDYLNGTNDLEELSMFLRDQGRYEQATMINYKIAQGYEHPDTKVHQLHMVLSENFVELDADLELERIAAEEAKLVELQRAIEKLDTNSKAEIFTKFPKHCSLIGVSALATLYYCCLYHYDDPVSSIANPTNVQKRLEIEEHHLHYISITALTRQSRWPDIERLVMPNANKGNFSPKGLLSSIKGNKLTLPFKTEVLFRGLTRGEVEPPKDLLCRLLRAERDAQERLRLAMQFNVPEMVIECLVAKGDRAALSSYAMKLPENSPELFKAMAALTNTSIKWKS